MHKKCSAFFSSYAADDSTETIKTRTKVTSKFLLFLTRSLVEVGPAVGYDSVKIHKKVPYHVVHILLN